MQAYLNFEIMANDTLFQNKARNRKVLVHLAHPRIPVTLYPDIWVVKERQLGINAGTSRVDGLPVVGPQHMGPTWGPTRDPAFDDRLTKDYRFAMIVRQWR